MQRYALGLVTDSDFKRWQRNEPPIDLLHAPYHCTKPLFTEYGVRARTRADWRTKAIEGGLRQIDVKSTRADHLKLRQEDAYYIDTIKMGGSMAKTDIYQINKNGDPKCQYCGN